MCAWFDDVEFLLLPAYLFALLGAQRIATRVLMGQDGMALWLLVVSSRPYHGALFLFSSLRGSWTSPHRNVSGTIRKIRRMR